MKLILCMSVVEQNGSKFVATNLANYTKILYPSKKVALVDFDFKNPYLAERLSLHDDIHGIDNITDKIDGNFLTPELFEENMVHIKNDVHLLKGVKSTSSKKFISKNHINKIIDLLKESYDYAFVAVSNEVLPSTVYSLFNADEILLITKNNYTNYNQIDKAVELIKAYKNDTSNVRMVINQYSEQSEVTFNEKVKPLNVMDINLVPYMPECFDNIDLDKTLINSKVFRGKQRSQEVFKSILEKLV